MDPAPCQQLRRILRERMQNIDMRPRPETSPLARVAAGLVGTGLAVHAMRFTLGKPVLVPRYLPTPLRVGAWAIATVLTLGGFYHAYDYYYMDKDHPEWTRV
jgi:hypothetical protein